jgi:DNA-binding MarR family transcriptional regulator
MEPKHVGGSGSGRPRRVLRQLERLGQRTGRFIEDRLQSLDLTDLEVHVLLHLGPEGRAVNELQRAFGIQPSTMTGVLDRLERRGFTRREVNPGDRRSFLITLTPAGVEVGAEVRAVVDDFEESVRRRVSAADLEAFFRVVDAVDQLTG